MRGIKILHIITRLIVGGAQENTMYSILGLMRKGYEVRLLSGPTYGPEGEIVSEIKKKGIYLSIIRELRRNINPLIDLIAFIRIYKFIRRYKPEVVHTHSSKAGILGRIAASMAGTRCIVHTIHGLPYHKFQNRLIRHFYILSERIAALFCHRILSVSKNLIRIAVKDKIAREHKFRVVFSGINISDFLNPDINSSELQGSLGIVPNQDFVIGTIARLFHLKGHKYIISCSRKIIEKHPNVKFLFVGDGILRENFIKRLKDLNLKKHFIFTGLVPRDRIPDYISLMNLVVHPSLREGLARVIPQGLLMEKPIVIFDIDGASDIIKEAETGYLVQPKNTEQMKDKILFCIENYQKAKETAFNGKKIVLKLFPIEKMVNTIEKIYLINKKN